MFTQNEFQVFGVRKLYNMLAAKHFCLLFKPLKEGFS